MTDADELDVAQRYIRSRMAQLGTRRLAWNQRDVSALEVVLRGTSNERIALARVEGRVSGRNIVDGETLTMLKQITRAALGL